MSSKKSFENLSKLQVVECMTTAIKTFSFSSEILFLCIDLLNRYLIKVKESSTDFHDQATFNLAGLVIVSLIVRYQERINLNVAALAKLVNIDCSNNEEVIKQLECNILATVQFKIYPTVQASELVQKVSFLMQQVPELQSLTPECQSQIIAKAMYFSFLVQCRSNDEFTPQEIASASIYIAMKVIEKKMKTTIVSRPLFEQIMRHNSCDNESNVIKCSSQVFETIQKAKEFF